MKPQFTGDQEQRRRAVEETHSSFVVEASAGAGKTSILIDRILHLVLEKGPGGRPLPLSSICAITFTEKAAGEMKVRLRQRFEEIISGGNSDERSDRARKAVEDLETASISTFHSFAVSLLKERPVEAGLDPRFTALDDIRSELFFREIWTQWIGRTLAERNTILEKALRGGFRLDSLTNLARMLRLHGPAVRALECDSPPSEDEVRERIRAFLKRGREFPGLAIKPDARLVEYLGKALNWLEAPAEADGPARPGNAGSAAKWSGGKDTVQAIREFIREVVDFRRSYRNLPVQRLLGEVVCWIKEDFLKEWESRKRESAFLDFDDQLWLARDMLLKKKAVRREFQSRYATLLVDEFQDTDPVQWDIVLLLSAENSEETDLLRLRPGPGRLFLVGDPKQSIYRFRNADIETYLEVADPDRAKSRGLERLPLTTNFRSVPSILRFVDSAFDDVMKAPEDGRYQPDYLSFGGEGFRTEELSPPSVSLLADREDPNGSTSTVREFFGREASRIAGLIRQMHGSGSWKIHDRDERKGGGWRAPGYGDIAILLPVLSRADILEDALREADIPYVLEGGKFYYARSEVSSAITILRAVANPNDSVALYGALRSIFFGLSDEDLLRTKIEGQVLDYRSSPPPESPLCHPYEILRDLHLHRHERRPSETLELLLQKTGAREVLSVRGFQSLANLGKLARTMRALQEQATYSQVVQLLSAMDEEALAESESRLMEERSDAVRVMSIHKAKGLDFPIVIVAGLGLRRLNRTKSLLADPHRRNTFALSLGSRDSGLQTPAWQEMVEEEKKRENAELMRLLYVALTRARDHMVLCTHTRNWKKIENSEEWTPDTEGTRLKPLDLLLAKCFSDNSGLVRKLDVDSLDAVTHPRQSPLFSGPKDWPSIVERECRELNALLRETPSSKSLKPAGQHEADSEDYKPTESVPEAVTRAVRLGLAFHEAMEKADLSGLTVRSVQNVSTKHRLDLESARELAEMVHTTLSSPLLERARAAVRSGNRVLRELPFVRPLDSSRIEEGKIDLLFEEPEGWVLVDYKTDRTLETSKLLENYTAQLTEYAKALEALSLKVKSVFLIHARTGRAFEVNLS